MGDTRFSDFVIQAIDASKFTAQRDSYGGKMFGFYSTEDANAKVPRDKWELWVWKSWFWQIPNVQLTRNGKFLDRLTHSEKIDLYEAAQRGTIKAREWEAEARIRKIRKEEAEHWWP